MGTAHWVRPSGTELVASGMILTHVAWVVAVLAVRPTEVSGVRGVAAAAGSAATGSAAGLHGWVGDRGEDDGFVLQQTAARRRAGW